MRHQPGIRRTRLILGSLILIAGYASLFLAYQLRFEFDLPRGPIDWEGRMWETMGWILPLEYILFYAFGFFTPLVARFRWRDLLRVGVAVGIITLFLLYLWYVFSGQKTAPRSVILINGLLLLLALSLIQSLSANLQSILTGRASDLPVRAFRVVLVGKGVLADQIIQHAQTRRGLAMRVVGIVFARGERPDALHWQGVPVGGSIARMEEVCQRFDPDRVIICDPEASAETIRTVVRQCRLQRVPVFIVPSAQEMFDGVLTMEAIRPVGLDDVLGRNALEIDLPRIHQLLTGKRVLVTGAGGSIGSELCRQILPLGPSKLLVLDSSEAALFQIEQDLRSRRLGECVQPMMVNIRDRSAVEHVIAREQPEIIFHSAALKHVPMVESFPGEALLTNTLATNQLAELAAQYDVERMVFISTDKAINPTNVMGASKRLAEQLLQARPRGNGHTAFVAVRFGNVIGSSGSVIPIFEKQIAAGGPITVTHADITRYFMSIPEAVGLVLQSATQGSGGEIFMLDMGAPIKVLEVARMMIQLRGLEPEEDIEIKIVGLRPGEKLFEELSYDAEIHGRTTHPRVYKLTAPGLSPEAAADLLARIEKVAQLSDADAIREAVKELLPEFVEASAPMSTGC